MIVAVETLLKESVTRKKTIPKPPGSLNDNPIMYSIPGAALQSSGKLLHEDKHHPFTRKKPFYNTKKVPELHSQGTCGFLQKTVLIKIELQKILFRLNISVQQ